MTQMQVAKLLGQPQSFISKYERGERRLDFTEFVELTDILEIDVPTFVTSYQAALDLSKQKSRRKKFEK